MCCGAGRRFNVLATGREFHGEDDMLVRASRESECLSCSETCMGWPRTVSLFSVLYQAAIEIVHRSLILCRNVPEPIVKVSMLTDKHGVMSHELV
jgi:hypothetical protein